MNPRIKLAEIANDGPIYHVETLLILNAVVTKELSSPQRLAIMQTLGLKERPVSHDSGQPYQGMAQR